MNGFKKLALLAVCTFALLTAGSAPASAGTAHLEVVDDDWVTIGDCDVTFNNTGVPPTSPITISNMQNGSCSEPTKIIGGGGTLTIGSTASLAFTLTIDPAPFLPNCTWNGTLTGPAAATTLTGSATSGGFFCPSPINLILTSITY